MIAQNETGICNFTNPGQINLQDIINIYNDITKSQITPISNSNTINAVINNRSFARLQTEKIAKYCPLNITEAVKDCCEKYNTPMKLDKS
jgi:hypothetical protein